MSTPNHIFLVDDEETFNFLNKTVIKLKLPETRISIFSNGEEAIENLPTGKPDLVFLDMYMPVMDGWQFLELVEQGDSQTKVIMLTASIDPREKQKALSYSSVIGVYSKPLTLDMIDEIAEGL